MQRNICTVPRQRFSTNQKPPVGGFCVRGVLLSLGGFEASEALYWTIAAWLEWDLASSSTVCTNGVEHLARGVHAVAFCACAIAAACWLVVPTFFGEERLVALGKHEFFSAVAARKGDVWHTLLRLTRAFLPTGQLQQRWHLINLDF